MLLRRPDLSLLENSRSTDAFYDANAAGLAGRQRALRWAADVARDHPEEMRRRFD